MIEYILVFSASTFLFAISPRIVRNQRKIILAIALLLPCFLAGFRGNEVGTDVLLYLKPLTDAAIHSENFVEYLNSSWIAMWVLRNTKMYEIAFVMVVYLTAKIFRSIYAVQFFVQLMVIMPIYLALKRQRNNVPLWCGILVYFFLFFNSSLNMMRQAIAMSWAFLAMQYFKENNIKKYILFQVIAFAFHKSALIVVFICFSYTYVCGKPSIVMLRSRSEWTQIKKIIILSILALCVLFLMNYIAEFLQVIGLDRYAAYIMGTLKFMPNQIIIRLPILFLCLFYWKRLNQNNKNFPFLFLMLVFVFIFTQLASVNSFALRISMYFELLYLELMPQIYSVIRSRKYNKSKVSFASIIVLAYLVFYWWFFYAYGGRGETVPYVFGPL